MATKLCEPSIEGVNSHHGQKSWVNGFFGFTSSAVVRKSRCTSPTINVGIEYFYHEILVEFGKYRRFTSVP